MFSGAGGLFTKVASHIWHIYSLQITSCCWGLRYTLGCGSKILEGFLLNLKIFNYQIHSSAHQSAPDAKIKVFGWHDLLSELKSVTFSLEAVWEQTRWWSGGWDGEREAVADYLNITGLCLVPVISQILNRRDLALRIQITSKYSRFPSQCAFKIQQEIKAKSV